MLLKQSYYWENLNSEVQPIIVARPYFFVLRMSPRIRVPKSVHCVNRWQINGILIRNRKKFIL